MPGAGVTQSAQCSMTRGDQSPRWGRDRNRVAGSDGVSRAGWFYGPSIPSSIAGVNDDQAKHPDPAKGKKTAKGQRVDLWRCREGETDDIALVNGGSSASTPRGI